MYKFGFRYHLITMVLLLGLLQTACVEIPDIPSEYKLQGNNTTGLLAVNVTFNNIPYVNSFWFNYRGLDNKVKSSVSAIGLGRKEAWSNYYEEGEKGRLALVELAAGEYEFYSWGGSMGGWGGVRTLNSTRDFSKRFSVTAGKITYIGNIHLSVSGLSKIAISQKLPSAVIINDRRLKDIPAIFEKHPSLSKDDLIIKIMQDKN